MTLEQIKELIILLSGENGLKVDYSPEDFEDMLHNSQLRHFKVKLGLPEEYQPGMPLPRQAFELNQRMTEDMRHFKVIKGWNFSQPLDVDTVTGSLDYPSGYYIISTMSWFYAPNSNEVYERDIIPKSDLEFNKAITSFVEEPDNMFPICNMQADFIRISPKNIDTVNMVYLRLPKRPIYKVIDNGDHYQYDAENSQELEWDEMNQIDIVVLLLADLGIPLVNQAVLEYAQTIKKEGR